MCNPQKSRPVDKVRFLSFSFCRLYILKMCIGHMSLFFYWEWESCLKVLAIFCKDMQSLKTLGCFSHLPPVLQCIGWRALNRLPQPLQISLCSEWLALLYSMTLWRITQTCGRQNILIINSPVTGTSGLGQIPGKLLLPLIPFSSLTHQLYILSVKYKFSHVLKYPLGTVTHLVALYILCLPSLL